ncbi:TetR/AcrR family transcriptional regulator [Pendulispora albinea]|uniref:TetR/AcrR family transcriptional regulator n=1 Tax=Pendulispora albinea TaxID=2741071 RepID=A0ABZ2M655_9BACT
METERPKVGRKRSEAARKAILRASLELLRERGYGKVTVDAIAERAGVGKQTMYRWWRSKADVVLEALTEEARVAIVDRDSNDLESDLGAFLKATFRLLNPPRALGPVMSGLMAEAQLDPAFGARFGDYIAWRRKSLGAIFQRAAERNELSADADIELLVDMVFGAMWYRLLLDRPISPKFATSLARTATRAARAQKS